MSDQDIIEMIAKVVEDHQFRIDHGSSKQPMCCECQEGRANADGWMLDMEPRDHPAHVAQEMFDALLEAGYAVTPFTWDVLMAQLDRHYPADIFGSTAGDNPERDPGPRIVSLIRRINEIRQGVRRARL